MGLLVPWFNMRPFRFRAPRVYLERLNLISIYPDEKPPGKFLMADRLLFTNQSTKFQVTISAGEMCQYIAKKQD